jgi:hypothetical protein
LEPQPSHRGAASCSSDDELADGYAGAGDYPGADGYAGAGDYHGADDYPGAEAVTPSSPPLRREPGG